MLRLRLTVRTVLAPAAALCLLASACSDEGDGGLDAGNGGDASGQDMGTRDVGGGSDTGSQDDLGGMEDMGTGMIDMGQPDMGEPDLGPEDMGPLDMGAFSCAEPETLTGVLDGEVSIVVDTSVTELRPRDLGLLCGNTSPTVRWPKQTIVAYEVPGTGGVAVSFDTRSTTTPSVFDTVVQVRTTCEDPPPLQDAPLPDLTCFDDSGVNANAPDRRSAGTVQATGGDILYFVVTGFRDPDQSNLISEGEVELTVTASENSPPQLTGGTAFVFGNDVVLRLEGTDADDNVRGAIVNLRRGGNLLDIYGQGTTSPTRSALIFDRAPGEVLNFIRRRQPPLYLSPGPPTDGSGNYSLPNSEVGLNPPLGQFVAGNNVDRLGVTLYDEAFASSNEVLLQVVTNAQRVGFGEDCSNAVCQPPLRCGMDNTCGASELGELYCDPANIQDSGLAPGVGVFAQVELSVSIPPDNAFAGPSCATNSAAGGESVVSLQLPMGGTFDVLATTQTQVTGALNTLIHMRSDCLNDATELPGSCNDDASGTTRASAFEVRDLGGGTYYIFTERFTSTPSTNAFLAGLDISLRPVVGLGEACDPAGVQSRCATGTCQNDGANDICAE